MDQKRDLNYPSRFAFLIGFMGLGIILGSILLVVTASVVLQIPLKQVADALLRPENANLSRILNTLGAFLIFFLPAYALYRVISTKPFKQLGFHSTMSIKQVVLVMVLTFVSIFLSGALGQLNESIPLPHDFYIWAKEKEDAYKASMMSMATMKNATDYILSLLVLAFFPAMVEEVFFRGGLQQVMIGWTKNKWWGVVITSILFSAIHISYFGFLPRIALGMVLGFIFYYSKNLWLNIFLHFLNNALVVTQLYIMSQKGKPIDKTIDEKVPLWWGVIALGLLIIVFGVFKKESAAVKC